MLGLDIGRAELAGLIPRKEDHAPCFLRIAFEHTNLPFASSSRLAEPASSLLQAFRGSDRPVSLPASAQLARPDFALPPETPGNASFAPNGSLMLKGAYQPDCRRRSYCQVDYYPTLIDRRSSKSNPRPGRLHLSDS